MFKILLLGTNKIVIDDLFNQLGEVFEVLTSSLRYEDVMNHIKYVRPDAIVYCLKNENRDIMSRTVGVKNNMKEHIPFFIVGHEAECREFKNCATGVADYTLLKPITAKKIQSSITEVLEKLHKNRPVEKETKVEQKTYTKENQPEFIIDDDEINSLLEMMDEALEHTESSNRGKGVSSKTVVGTGAAKVQKAPVVEKTAGMGKQVSAKKHILIVDDDVQMQKTIKHHLEDKYDIATAINGSLALRFVQKKHTDLILLDYAMPEMNGLEVLEAIRANPATKNIPVIFLTGLSDKEKIQKLIPLNPQGYILKPTDQNTLLKTISNVLK